MKFSAPYFLLLVGLAFTSCRTESQVQTIKDIPILAPTTDIKLVVGITVDQMRYDYLTRYENDYVEGGLKLLMEKGVVCHNHHYSYAPTFTGPGHASIYTGTTPEIHGIISNNWYDHMIDSVVYCAGDGSENGVGTSNAGGKMSPRRMTTTSMCDELKLFSNHRSKTIGVSMKDRGAILPAGHTANAAYWYIGGEEGNFVTSTYYMENLPEWVNEFNNRGLSQQYLEQGWDRILDESAYDESAPDNNPYEGSFAGQTRPTFPYNLQELADTNGTYNLIKATPWGNTITFDFAKAAVIGEDLGKDEHTDFLAVSFSSTDYVGHQFGPHSQEAQDTYLRLDRDLADFISFLNNSVGEDNYLVFLTADHGAVHVPSYLQSKKVPADYWNPGNMVEDVKAMLNERWGEANWIINYSNDQFFIDKNLIQEKSADVEAMEDAIASMVLQYEGVQATYTRHDLVKPFRSEGLATQAAHGFSPTRSGNVVVFIKPGWLRYGRTGTSHGSPYAYDSHVPFIVYTNASEGKKIFNRTEIRDIAPTICTILGIQMPNGTTGSAIPEVTSEFRK